MTALAATVLAATLDAQEIAEFTELRRDLHRQPELAYAEVRTAAIVAQRLIAEGWSVHTGLAGTGVVASLRRGSGASVGLRADLDALPLGENGQHAHCSAVSGTMHACGHDGHVPMLLAAARLLARDTTWRGTVHLIFQPAEEIGVDSGAQRMVKEGLFERFPCDAVFGMHNHPGIASGTFMCRTGPFMSASDVVKITVKGKGGHAARPHLAVDASLVVASIVTSLQSVVSRSIDPAQPAVVSVGRMHAGETYNVIPEIGEIELSVRSFDPKVRQLLHERICAIAQAQAAGFGAHVDIDYKFGYPVLINHPRETQLAVQAARLVAGDAAVDDHGAQIMGSEDFAYMLEARPGCLIRIGNGTDSHGLHNPNYDFNDSNIAIGARYWATLAALSLSEFSNPQKSVTS